QPGAEWDLQQSLLQAGDERAQFAKDRLRDSIALNDGILPPLIPRQVVQKGLEMLLDGYPTSLRPQIEFLLTQGTYSLDNKFMEAFVGRYMNAGMTLCAMDDTSGREFTENVYHVRRVGDFLQVSSVKYFRFQGQDPTTSEYFYLYDALRVE